MEQLLDCSIISVHLNSIQNFPPQVICHSSVSVQQSGKIGRQGDLKR
ncbi:MULTISPECIES: hypothetical protein [unclassified Wolbachia]|nr:hypothetical protein [Wolbachia endosymbiont (group A) of Apoderus coryli]